MEKKQLCDRMGGKEKRKKTFRDNRKKFLAYVAAALLLTVSCGAAAVQAAEKERPVVRISGSTVGIYMETDGVLVIGTSQIPTNDGLSADPAGTIVRAGDYICSVNHEPLTGKRQLTELVEKSNGQPMELVIRRGEEKIPVSIRPVLSTDGSYKIGVWVRDNIQGIGTLTYVEDDGTFGALGHAISDVDTGEILNLKDGELYLTDILSVVKGEKGNPGELQGVIRYEQGNRLGSIDTNSGLGIHGKLDAAADGMLNLQRIETAWKEEVKTGPAQIFTTVDKEVHAYDAEIVKIDNDAEDTNKSFTIKITDPELLAKTGGIVQGMSGSPIIQNGRLVGAVTHVFVADASCGYGIFIENMM